MVVSLYRVVHVEFSPLFSWLMQVDLVAFIIVMSYILDNLVADPQQQSTARTQGSVQKPSQGSKQMKKEVDSHHFDLLQKRKAELLDYCRKKYLEKYGG